MSQQTDNGRNFRRTPPGFGSPIRWARQRKIYSYVAVRTLIDQAGGSDSVVRSAGTYAQRDTWRPRLKPDNTVVLACNTPVTEHDSSTGYTHMTFLLFDATGTNRTSVKGTPTSLTWTSYGHPEWAPNGLSVVIFVETATEYKIQLLDGTTFANSTVLHTVTKPDTNLDPSFSPDGTKVVFTELVGSTYGIARVTSAGASYTQLKTGSNLLADPTYSPDGTHILYAEKTGVIDGGHPYGQWALKYMPAAGGIATTILSTSNANLHPVWITDDLIAFQLFRYGTDSLFKIASIGIDGSGLAVLGTGEYPDVRDL